MVWTYTALAPSHSSGLDTQVDSHAPKPDFEYSIVGDIVFMSSTRSFAGRSLELDPIATLKDCRSCGCGRGWDWRHIVYSHHLQRCWRNYHF